MMMPGKTRRKYDGETMRIYKKLKTPLKLVAEILPQEYDCKILLDFFMELYPFEWKEIVERQKYFQEKDEFLKSNGIKKRYKSTTPEKFFYSIPFVKNILSNNYRQKHIEHFNDVEREKKYQKLKQKRYNKIHKRNSKVESFTNLMQEVEPYYVDALIAAYHQKGISIEGKMEILKEMEKFDCSKTIEFFQKINDSERNDQIRHYAYSFLQKSGHYVTLRKNFEGKKKSYMVETTDFNMTPMDLAARLKKDTVQNKKRFGVFISHSFKDAELVKQVISILNKQGLTCYCDWLSDNDFLKRSLVSNYTKEVLKKRLEQSEKILFLRTENSMSGNSINSTWIELELQHSQALQKPIYCIDMLEDSTALPYRFIKMDIENKIISWEVQDERQHRGKNSLFRNDTKYNDKNVG